MSGAIAADVAAVVVLYHPAALVAENVAAARAQCARVIAVPNSPPGTIEAELSAGGVSVLAYESNGGTARGFNRGIEAAFTDPAIHYVLLLDQDSRVTEGMVAALVAAHGDARASGLSVGAVGPVLGDVKDAHGRAPSDGGAGVMLPTASLASSGTLIPRSVFSAVGGMDESLFIDGVDHEWCLRARARGYPVYAVPRVRLAHNMGDRLVRIGSRARPLHDNPVRHYYIIRNSLLLARRDYLPVRWRARELALTARRFVGYAVLSAHRLESVRYMTRAVMDAARKRSGPLPAR